MTSGHSAFSQFLSYSRLVFLVISWYFAPDQPEAFLAIYLSQIMFGTLVMIITNLETESMNNKYLRLMTQIVSTSIILFATIRQSIDFSK
jgi:hypothetical protein